MSRCELAGKCALARWWLLRRNRCTCLGYRGIYTPGGSSRFYARPQMSALDWCSGDSLHRRPQLKSPPEIFTVAAELGVIRVMVCDLVILDSRVRAQECVYWMARVGATMAELQMRLQELLVF